MLDPDSSTSVDEITLHQRELNRVYPQLEAAATVMRSMARLRPSSVPGGQIGIDLVLPRRVFDDEVGKFGEALERFDAFFKVINEMATGSRESPKVSQLSTSEPSIVIPFLPAAAIGILLGYKLILELIEKHLNMWKTIREIRAFGDIKDGDLEKTVEQMRESDAGKAVESTLGRLQSLKAEGERIKSDRANELKGEGKRVFLNITADIEKGARLSISLESRKDASRLIAEITSSDELTTLTKEQRALERRLDALTAVPLPALPKSETPTSET